jgi:HK97 family phage prohead protease
MDIDPIQFEGPEARSVAFTDLDVSKGGREFDGYAGVYGQEFDAGQFIETMLPPALRSGISKSKNVPMLWHHNDQFPPFATSGAGTLALSEDRRGLRVKAEIDERHILGPTLISMMERGEVRGMSVGMVVGSENHKLTNKAGRVHRAIHGMRKLLDVSPTWEPAYEGTSAELRSLTEAFQQVPALEPEQVPEGEPESLEDGPNQQDAETKDPAEVCEHGDGCEACQADTEPVEERSRAEGDPMVAAAARRRRLQMLGISLPSE